MITEMSFSYLSSNRHCSVHIEWNVIHSNWVIYMQRYLPSALKSTFRQLAIAIHGNHANIVWISHNVTIFIFINSSILGFNQIENFDLKAFWPKTE